MSHFIIEAFNNGLDLRRSRDTALVGSLRVLRNAFINEGGEIEKRKAFFLEPTVTAYAQNANYKGRITGPFEVPGDQEAVFFRHRHNSLPTTGWTAGAGTEASYYDAAGSVRMRFWAMKSAITMPSPVALVHGASYAQYADNGHIIEAYIDDTSQPYETQHVQVTFTAGEPTAETEVSANADRSYMIVLLDKGYVVDETTLYASAVANPGAMTGTGSGSVDLRTQGKPIGNAIGITEYYGQLVTFGVRGARFWSVDPDFTANQYLRTIQTSLVSGRSLQGFGDGDVLYLGRSGVRSLQARDSSNQARISDVGSPIDSAIRAALITNASDAELMLADLTETLHAEYFDLALSDVLLETGQYWLAFRQRIYVLSVYEGVRAWSVYDVPQPLAANENTSTGYEKGRWIADMCPIRETLVMRNFADEVFIYGGVNGTSYDASLVEVVTPHMDLGSPGTKKDFTGVDLSCIGEWSVEVSLDPDPDGEVWDLVARIENTSFRQAKIGFNLTGTHIALRLTSTTAEAAKVGQAVIYYEGGEEK